MLIDVSITSVVDSPTGIQRVIDRLIAASSPNRYGRGGNKLSFSPVSFLDRQGSGVILKYVSIEARQHRPKVEYRLANVVLKLRRQLGKMGLEPFFGTKIGLALAKFTARALAYQLPWSESRSENQIVLPNKDIHLLLGDSFWHPRSGAFKFAKELKNLGGSFSVLCFDILPITRPDLFVPEITSTFVERVPWVLQNASVIIVNSEKVRLDVLDAFPNIAARRVQVVRLASEFSEPAESNQRIPKSVVAVGTIEPRKNYKILLEWWQRFGRHEGWKLTIVGRAGWGTADLQKALREERSPGFTWLENASDVDLQQAFVSHEIGVSASFDEGFGLPALEMQTAGLKVGLSDIEIYRELHPEVPKFDPNSAQSLHEMLVGIHGSDRSNLVPADRTWNQVAEEIFKCILERPKDDPGKSS